jgi:glycerol-3-phosphate dehydrogenase
MRFVLPYHRDMRFDSATPTSRLLNTVMPWMRGRRPAWLIRMGLFLYDNLGGRKILPGTEKLDLRNAPEGRGLQAKFERAYEYSDCWIEDSRLVVLNARDADARGAVILPRHKVTQAAQNDGIWSINVVSSEGVSHSISARAVVNAAGPWVGDVLSGTLKSNASDTVRLVRGSHIVTKRLFDHDKCYFFQGTDGRITFAIPYETDFTLIGTTDAEHANADETPECSDEERDYLIDFVNGYLAAPINVDDVVWSYSGVRPLYDDGATSATAATRDYVLKLDQSRGAPALNVFGGKITTYRRLAESALDELRAVFPDVSGTWTAGVALPGGDFAVDGIAALIEKLCRAYPFLTGAWARRLVRAYGTDAFAVLGEAKGIRDLGVDFGATLTEAEVRWLVSKEYVQQAEDILWRRSKLGLRMSVADTERLRIWLQKFRAQGTKKAEI